MNSGTLTATAGTTGVAVSGSGTGSVTLAGTIVQINNLLAGNSGATLSYIINSDTPPASDVLTLTANDQGNTGSGGALTGSDTATINITAVNDPPVNNVPGPQTTPTNAQLTFSTSNGNVIWISDVDAGTDDVSFSLTATHGTVTLPGLPGIHGLTGPISSLNSHLDGLVFTPDPGYTGLASIQITTNDLGHNGSGSAPNVVTPVPITVGSTLLAAGGDVAGSSTAVPLTQADLQPIVNEAIARWVAAGLSAQSVDAMSKARFVVTNLPGAELGLAGGGTIYVDSNAAGYGWFVDATPAKDEEFSATGSGSQLQAIDPRAVDRMDLLTVVEHELGHIAGLDDLASSMSSLMSSSLGEGLRRSPTAKEVEAVFAAGDFLS